MADAGENGRATNGANTRRPPRGLIRGKETMPELPDVHGFKTYLDATALHQRIAHTSIRDERFLRGASRQTISRRLKGRALEETGRHGKFLFARAGDAGWLVLHFGMTGELAYYEDESDEPEYAKLVLDFNGGRRLAYINKRRLGRIDFTDAPAAFVEKQELGPDAMSGELDRTAFAERLAGRTGMIKPALMNQETIAGIGNVYSDEVLFQARMHPKTPVNELDDDAVGRLYRVMRRVLRVACEKRAEVDELPRGWLLPVRAEGEPCPKCGGTLKKITVSGRSGIYCPECQAR
jgi:formamidopyrimidine-DNA glycosylase